jgi:hypothetical protein
MQAWIAAGMQAFRAAAQDHRVARLQRQRARIGRHVRPALVDNPDDADGRPDAADVQARGPVPFGDDLPDRIGLGGDLAQPRGDGGEAAAVQPQPVQHRLGQSLLAREIQILRIRREDPGLLRPDRIRGGLQRLRLVLGWRLGQRQGRIARPLAKVPDQLLRLCHLRHVILTSVPPLMTVRPF